MSLLDILPNSNLLRTLQRAFFWTFISENLAPPLIFLVLILSRYPGKTYCVGKCKNKKKKKIIENWIIGALERFRSPL